MKCEEINELLVAYLDEELSSDERSRIEAHLPTCKKCQEDLRLLDSTLQGLRQALRARAADVEPSPQVWGQVRQRIALNSPPWERFKGMFNSPMRRMIPVTLIFVVLGALWWSGALSEFVGLEKPASRPSVTTIAPELANFIKINNITYVRNFSSLESYREGDFTYYDSVTFKVAGNVNEPGYKTKNGDAAFLEEGTSIYSLNDYSPSFRLAARTEEGMLLYEADTNPNAKIGADLLDVGGKVKYIGINSPIDGITELASIKEESMVSSLTEIVLNAPVDQTVHPIGGEQLFIAFHLSDGTVVGRSFWPDTGELSRGILLPDEFGRIIRTFLP